MPPNFICFFLSFLSSALPQKKTRDWFLLKTRKAGKGAKQKEQKTRDGRLIKIEKREITSPLSSLTSLSSFAKTGGWVKIQIKSKTVLSLTHTISLLIVFGNFSKPPNMLSPPVDFFPLDDGILEGSMITCLMFARLHVYVTCTIPSLACIIAG